MSEEANAIDVRTGASEVPGAAPKTLSGVGNLAPIRFLEEVPRLRDRVNARMLLWAPFRVVPRFATCALWIFACYLATLGATALGWAYPEQSRWLRKRVARRCMNGMMRIVGMRVRHEGTPPKSPYFLVVNHISWGDLFIMTKLVDASTVLQGEDRTFPFIGRILCSLDPIFTSRRRETVRQELDLMVRKIRQDKNVLMAPEGIVSPGREVRRFRAALLESAVLTGRPVHYASITCRVPEGYPPASRSALFGPDQFFRTEDGRIPQSELEAWGPERSFLWHLLGLLALPWHEFTVKFAPKPILGTDKWQLANDLRDAVQAIFTPVE